MSLKVGRADGRFQHAARKMRLSNTIQSTAENNSGPGEACGSPLLLSMNTMFTRGNSISRALAVTFQFVESVQLQFLQSFFIIIIVPVSVKFFLHHFNISFSFKNIIKQKTQLSLTNRATPLEVTKHGTFSI